MGSLTKRHTLVSRTAIALLALSSSVAFAASPSPTATSDFFNVTPEVPANAVHTPTDLSQIFQTGSGPYSTSMANKIYPYPMTRNGVPGAPLYNGCYNRKGIRLPVSAGGNLDADNSCTTAIQRNPGIAIFRLFVGYKVDCADAPFVAPTCKDMRLLMNCMYSQVQTGTSAFENYTAPVRECSAEHGIVRKANANSVITPAHTGCYPGTDGLSYPSCNLCPTGTFNELYDPNDQPCKKCGDVMTVTNVDSSNPIDMNNDWVSSSGLDGSLPNQIKGSTSKGDCKLKPSLPWQCASGYVKDPYEQSCVLAPPVCKLGMSAAPVNPTSTVATDGSLTITLNGAQGGVSAFSITAPTPNAGSGTNPKTFSGLGVGTYTVTATDSVCSQSNTYTLTASPPPSPSPAPSPTSGCLHVLNVVQPTTSTSADGKFDVHVDGSGTFSFTISPNPNSVMTQTVPSPSVMSGNFTYSGLGQGPYTVTSTGTCADTQSVTLTPPLTPSCALTLSAAMLNATNSATSSNGSITANTSGASGSVNFTVTPAMGTVATSGNNATISNLTNGSYVVKATDSGVPGCTKSATVVIQDCPSLYDNTTSPTTPVPYAEYCGNCSAGGNCGSWSGPYSYSPTSGPGYDTSWGGTVAAYPTTGGPGYGCGCNITWQMWAESAKTGPGSCYDCFDSSGPKNCAIVTTVAKYSGCKSGSPSPTPSPSPAPTPPPCNIATSTATSTLKVQCSYTCGSGTWNGIGLNTRSKNIAVGERCDSASAISRVQATGCNSPTVTSCYSEAVPFYSGMYETCSTAYTCPAGSHHEYVWDVSGQGQWGGSPSPWTYKTVCAHSSGATSIYAGCVPDGTPTPGTLYNCTQGYKAIYYPAGTPYCIE